jgi:tight adherence protein C
MTGFGLILAAAAPAAAVEAARAVLADRRANGGAPRAGRSPWLVAAGRPLLRTAPLLGWRPALLTGGRAAAAAASAGLSEADVAALRAGAAAVFASVGAAAFVLVGGPPGALLLVGAASFGVVYADVWLRSTDRARRERIDREAPALLELTAAAVASGVALDAALAGARGAVTGSLAQELDLARDNIDLGHPRRAELIDLAERTGSPALAGLALAVSLSDRLGVPLADALRRQARRARADRARAVQERAAAAGPRVLVVVVFVLVPAAMLPMAAAIALSVAGAVTGL